MDRYAVFGNPIGHSKSPLIHQHFAEQTAQRLAYDKQLVDLEHFSEAANAFFAAKGKGLNITVPFKLDAYAYADQLTERAKQAGAVNTLAICQDGKILGENTDGIGMLQDIVVNLGWQLKSKKILLLGAGGAVRGVLGPLLSTEPESIVIANRTPEKALRLAERFCTDGNIQGCGFDALNKQQYDIVINGTAASLSGDLPPLPAGLLSSTACCYDMMYGAEPSVFMNWARQHGAVEVADGLGMLVEQAAQSFELWRGVRPDTAKVMTLLRRQLGDSTV